MPLFSKKKSEKDSKLIESRDSKQINSNLISQSQSENLQTFNASDQYLQTADNSDLQHQQQQVSFQQSDNITLGDNTHRTITKQQHIGTSNNQQHSHQITYDQFSQSAILQSNHNQQTQKQHHINNQIQQQQKQYQELFHKQQQLLQNNIKNNIKEEEKSKSLIQSTSITKSKQSENKDELTSQLCKEKKKKKKKSVVSANYLKSEASEKQSKKANSTNYFKQFNQVSEPSVIQTELYSEIQSQTNQEGTEYEQEEEEEGNSMQEEQEEQEELEEEGEEYMTDKNLSTLSGDNHSENYKKVIQKRSDLEQLFLKFNYEPPKNLGEWGASVMWVMGRREQNFDPDLVNRDQDINNYIMKFQYLPLNVQIMQVVCTQQNTFLLSTQGKLYSWGLDTPVLGRDIFKREESYTPSEVVGFKDKLVQIAGGNSHILALDCRKRVYSWGSNDHGQLGHGLGQNIGLPVNRALPTMVQYFRNIKVVQVHAGADVSFAVSTTGQQYCWGQNQFGQLGITGIQYYPDPICMFITPWNANCETKFIASKNNRTYVYQYDNQADNEDEKVKGLRYQVKKLEFLVFEQQQQIQGLNMKLALFEQKQKGRTDNERGLNDYKDNQIEVMLQLMGDTNTKLSDKKEELRQQEKELEIILSQINVRQLEQEDLNNRQKKLTQQKDELELAIYKCIQNNTGNKNLEIFKNNQNKLKEQLTSTKKLIKQNLVMVTEKMKDRDYLTEKIVVTKEQYQDLNNKQFVYENIFNVRAENMKANQYQQEYNNLIKIIYNVHSFFKSVKETTIENIVKMNDHFKNIQMIINQSNESIQKLREGNQQNKLGKEEFNFEPVRQVNEIFEDNLLLRRKINEYQLGIMTQASNQFENWLLEQEKEFMNKDEEVMDDRQMRASQKSQRQVKNSMSRAKSQIMARSQTVNQSQTIQRNRSRQKNNNNSNNNRKCLGII